jgi:hypothetical protein
MSVTNSNIAGLGAGMSLLGERVFPADDAVTTATDVINMVSCIINIGKYI